MATTLDEVWAPFRETDRQFQETNRRFQQTEKRLNTLSRQLGEQGNRLGDFVQALISVAPDGYLKRLARLVRIRPRGVRPLNNPERVPKVRGFFLGERI